MTLFQRETELWLNVKDGSSTVRDRRLLRQIVRRLGGDWQRIHVGVKPDRPIVIERTTLNLRFNRLPTDSVCTVRHTDSDNYFRQYANSDSQQTDNTNDTLKPFTTSLSVENWFGLSSDPNAKRSAGKELRKITRRANADQYGDAVRHFRPFSQLVDSDGVSMCCGNGQRTGESAEELQDRLDNAADEWLATFDDGGKTWLDKQRGVVSMPSKFCVALDEHGDRKPVPVFCNNPGLAGHSSQTKKLSSKSLRKIAIARELLGDAVCDALASGATQTDIVASGIAGIGLRALQGRLATCRARGRELTRKPVKK